MNLTKPQSMNIKPTQIIILTGILLIGVFSAELANAQGTWNFAFSVNPETCWSNNGVVVKASNLGPIGVVQPVNVDGITFDTNLSNVTFAGDYGNGVIPENPAITQFYYAGTNSSVSNLVNSWAHMHEWYYEDAAQNLYINVTNLVVGHDYQFQLMIGFPWNDNGVNLYGADGAGTYGFVYNEVDSGTGQGDAGTNLCMATFTWTATASGGTFNANESLYPYYSDEQEYMAYSLIDTSLVPLATISSPAVLPGGKFRLTVNSAASTVFDIQISHNLSLTNWSTLATVTNISGADTYTNDAAISPSFFRLLQH
jgi:hypothetical protein